MQTLTHKPSSFSSVPTALLQRQCSCGGSAGHSGECEECKRKRQGTLQRSALGTRPVGGIPPIVHEVLRAPGQPLDAQTRAAVEPRFGADFSRVRIHTDEKAAQSADTVQALAYTVGSDIVFAGGRYAPHTGAGSRLLAHELTHVVQQGSVGAAGPLAIGAADSPAEVEAESTAAQITGGQALHMAAPVSAGLLQRQTPRPAPVDENAQRIIDLAQNAGRPIAERAVAVVRAIIDQYYSADASKISEIRYVRAETGLHVNYVGRGATTTGRLDVGDYFVTNTDQRNFARRVLQVRHEIEHVEQVRGGMVGETRSDEREFIAFYHEALATELAGTGRVQHSTRVPLIDGALGYYYCLSAELQASNTSRRDELIERRTVEVRRSGRSDLGSAPTSCVRQSD